MRYNGAPRRSYLADWNYSGYIGCSADAIHSFSLASPKLGRKKLFFRLKVSCFSFTLSWYTVMKFTFKTKISPQLAKKKEKEKKTSLRKKSHICL